MKKIQFKISGFNGNQTIYSSESLLGEFTYIEAIRYCDKRGWKAIF